MRLFEKKTCGCWRNWRELLLKCLVNIVLVLFGRIEGKIQFLRRHHILSSQCTCARYNLWKLVAHLQLHMCGLLMEEWPRNDVSDGYSWWCRQCKGRKTIREGIFFSKSKLTLQKWLFLLVLWAKDTPVIDAIDDAEIDSHTGVDIYQWLQEVCTTKLLQTPIILGGPRTIVQVDESLFHHKQKVSYHGTKS